jgi:cyclic-di-AMP phosphodiesterase PgpH
MLRQFVPSVDLLREPQLWPWLRSDLVGAVGGGLLTSVLSAMTIPVVGAMLGVVSKSRLQELADFESPLLRQIATRAPGTWAHSLSMANMAEMAANAIGADAQLVRVGAYYHDLGKTVQPEYFIENQQGQNPHDSLAPDVSADAIFSHITEGVKLARKHKVPEAVVEFIYTHHGDGLLEYFWHKNMQLGNPKKLDEREFHYPGCRPQRPETAILALCDAVEAASRTVTEPDLDKIKQLVRQIIFTKLEHGALSDSGLTIEDAERIVNSLVETLRSGRHVRVKYPWQKGDETSRDVQRAPAPAPVAIAAAPGDSEVIPLVPKSGGREPTHERVRVMTMPLASASREQPPVPKPPRSKEK